MRARIIKPEFFTSRSLSRVSIPAALTFQGLWADADPAGRGIADTRILKGHIWPLRDEITPDVIASHLEELAREHIALYCVDGEAYYAVLNWEKHQSKSYRTGEPVHPDPAQAEPCTTSCASCTTNRALREGKGREVIAPAARARPPQAAPADTEAAPGKRARKPDPLWDALTAALGEAVTRTEQSNRGRTASELRAAGATPDDVHARCREYRRRYPNMALTDSALRKHWSDLGQRAKATGRREGMGSGGAVIENPL